MSLIYIHIYNNFCKFLYNLYPIEHFSSDSTVTTILVQACASAVLLARPARGGGRGNKMLGARAGLGARNLDKTSGHWATAKGAHNA